MLPKNTFIDSSRNKPKDHDAVDDCLPPDAPLPCDSGEGRIGSGECETCVAGKFGTRERCVFCPTGYSKSDPAQVQCQKCSAVRTCVVPGATSQKAFTVPLEYFSVFESIGNGTHSGTIVTDDNKPLDKCSDTSRLTPVSG